jgi:hypothetical protein
MHNPQHSLDLKHQATRLAPRRLPPPVASPGLATAKFSITHRAALSSSVGPR